jgi:hypothetical protein
MVIQNNKLHLTISCLKLQCGFHVISDMWIVILNGRGYLEDIAMNGRIVMHFVGIVLGCVDCVCLALSRDQNWMF